MDATLTMTINKKQPHTQSPSAYVDCSFDKNSWIATSLNGPSRDQVQFEAPSIRVVYSDEQPNLAIYELKLQEMKHLKSGWNGYSAPAPSKLAAQSARNFISVLLKEHQEPKRVMPSAAGGVGVTQRRNGKKVFVEFFNDGKVFALFSDGISDPVSKEVVPIHHAFQVLTKEMQEYLDA